MTNVENPAQLGVELLRIVKIRIFIIECVAHRRLETAFHGTPAGRPARKRRSARCRPLTRPWLEERDGVEEEDLRDVLRLLA